MNRIIEIAEKYDIPIIEDAAEALGSRYDGTMVGRFGKLGILSFNGNKIITTSGGGALVSDDEDLIKKARFLATQARDKAPHYQHSEIGYNYRMSNIVAGIGRGQMEVIGARVRARRKNFDFYKSNLSGIKGVSFVEEPGAEYFSNRWLTTILIDPEITGTDRESVRLRMETENIETRPLWKPMHLQPVFSGYPAYVNGVSENLFDKGLCLPSGSNMTDEDRERVVESLKKALMA
jgi:dTDP-4-amino-4,6-dideoxygalactose transaminase